MHVVHRCRVRLRVKYITDIRIESSNNRLDFVPFRLIIYFTLVKKY
jgi:hypothetical protein